MSLTVSWSLKSLMVERVSVVLTVQQNWQMWEKSSAMVVWSEVR